MKHTIYTIQILMLLLISRSSFGQSGTFYYHSGKTGMYPDAVQFTPGREPDFVPGTVLLKQQDHYIRTTDVVLKHYETDQIGQEHFRYQQKINDIPVEGAIYAVHVAAGKIRSQNGEWIAEPPADLTTTPAISESAALQAAMKAFGAKTYKWELPAEEDFIKKESGDAAATFMPKAELVYYTDEQEVNADRMRLAYKLDLYAQEPVGRRVYFVDAETGAILGQREIMHNVNATGTAVTGYSGSQSITTDSYTGGYRLQETGRGNGIQTLNLNRGTSYSTATDFTDADNYWNNANTNLDQYATDAHWGAEKTYDYYKNTYNRNSIDNAGFAIRSYVHYSTNYFNAFWDGSRMTYGDGSSYDNYQPLTAIDVCGHEITHGLTAFTANLNYSYESGALNEGFSDIFGTVIEFYAKPTAGNWLIGEAFYTLRSMSNPNTYGQPDTYRGTNWANGTSDYGGVHTNSGVLNFWFYLLSQGGSGTNDNSVAYSVTGIGITKAAAIAYRTLTVYLTSTSQYANARTWSIQAAADLYGAASNEVIQTINAWNAVGVVDAQCPANLTITANVTAPNADYKQASGAITALNTITSGATAIYHAGNEVVLSPGFEAVNGSSFKAYIESCSGNYQIQPSAPETITYNIRPGDIKSTGAKPALTTNTLVVSPNPFTGKLAISYYLATNNRKAAIEVYSVTGAKVADLLQDGQAAGGTHRVEWNADNFPGGMYLVVLTTDTGKEVRRVVKK